MSEQKPPSLSEKISEAIQKYYDPDTPEDKSKLIEAFKELDNNPIYKPKMAIIIKKVNDRNYTVNMKPVRLDYDNNWVTPVELTQNELEAFSMHIAAVEE